VAFKCFVKRAHEYGIAVILDVVYNHFGPGDLDLWQFDGWSENNRGGIYFYNDDRANTPWGDTHPNYGRGEVRQYILDNVAMWLEEYHVDGIRFDGTITFALLMAPAALTYPMVGACSDNQYPSRSEIPWPYHNCRGPAEQRVAHQRRGSRRRRVRRAMGLQFCSPYPSGSDHAQDEQRSLEAIRDALCFSYNNDAFDRVIYSESHDEVANGKARVPQEVNPQDPKGWNSQKLSTLAAAMVFTAPGIPMLFQGQEFLEGGWFHDTIPVDWDQRDEFHGIVRLYRDLIRLRLNHDGLTRGLCGQFTQVYQLHDERKVIAYHRWDKGGPADDVVVVANFLREPQDSQVIGFPAAGTWKLRFNSDWQGYSKDFGGHPALTWSPNGRI